MYWSLFSRCVDTFYVHIRIGEKMHSRCLTDIKRMLGKTFIDQVSSYHFVAVFQILDRGWNFERPIFRILKIANVESCETSSYSIFQIFSNFNAPIFYNFPNPILLLSFFLINKFCKYRKFIRKFDDENVMTFELSKISEVF